MGFASESTIIGENFRRDLKKKISVNSTHIYRELNFFEEEMIKAQRKLLSINTENAESNKIETALPAARTLNCLKSPSQN